MNANPLRSGQYLQQPTGYRAFIPNPLLPDPPIVITPGLQVLLSQAVRGLGRMDGSMQTLSDPDLFVFMSVPKEAVLSRKIEGTLGSLENVQVNRFRNTCADQRIVADWLASFRFRPGKSCLDGVLSL